MYIERYLMLSHWIELPWDRQKNYHFLKYRIFLRNDSILMKFLVEIRTDYKVFFAHIFKSIGPVLRKLRPKMHFFTFSKTSKNTYITRKIHPHNYRHDGFSSYFGFGLKQSIGTFSAIQNVIWSRIDDFRTFWKLLDFLLFTYFSTSFFPVFGM